LNCFKENYINLFIGEFDNKIYLLSLIYNEFFIIFYNYIIKEIFNIFFLKDLFNNFEKIVFFELHEGRYSTPKADV
jgi:hypothetical protein